MPKSFQKPSIKADEVLPNTRVSGFFDPDGNSYPLPQIKLLRDWGYRIPMEPFKDYDTEGFIKTGNWDVGKDNRVIPKAIPHYSKKQEVMEQAKELGMDLSGKPKEREPDRDEFMSTREWQSAFGQHQAKWKLIPEPRPHFMNWFMDNHGDLFSYYLMKPIFTSPYNKDALDAMKVFIQYSKQLPKSEIAIEAPQESSYSAEEILATICNVLSPEEVASKALSDMGFEMEDFRQFVSSKRN